MKRSILLPLVCFLFVLPSVGQSLPEAAPASLGFDADRLDRIAALMQQHIDDDLMAGSVTLVARKGKIVFHKAQGHRDREDDTPMTDDTIFRIASMTKPIVSVAVMMLYEEGHFLLNEPVSKYIPAFKDPQVLDTYSESDTTYTTRPAAREITIRHLLTHSSGVPYGFIDPRLGPVYQKAGVRDGTLAANRTIKENVELIASLPLAHDPGERFTYGLSTDVLGYFVEVISGQTLSEFLQTRLFEPLGMHDTSFFINEDKLDRLASLYAPSPMGGIVSGIRMIPESSWTSNQRALFAPHTGAKTYFSGGSGLLSTSGDYARFLQMLLNGGELDGVRILGSRTVKLMTADHLGGASDTFRGDNATFGLGFSVVTKYGGNGTMQSKGTYGWGGIWHTTFWVDPKEELFAISMSQIYPSNHLSDHGVFETLVYQALVD